MVRDFFIKLFTDDNAPFRPHILPAGYFPLLTALDRHVLEKSYTSSEVKKALFDMHPLKALGPDGFQALFFHRYWNLVGNQLTILATKVLRGEESPDKLNETFSALIPKVDQPQMVTQLRPIGLCNVVYKVITKCLVNRLKTVLGKLISPNQSSFVPGRQISDNIIIVQEILHSMRRK